MYGPIEIIVGATPEMIHNWGWFLAFGIILVLLGIAAVMRAFTATVASMMFFGWLLIFSGIIEFVHAFMVGKWAGFFLHLLIALVFGITGALMVFRPTISAEAITFIRFLVFISWLPLAGVVCQAGVGKLRTERSRQSWAFCC